MCIYMSHVMLYICHMSILTYQRSDVMSLCSADILQIQVTGYDSYVTDNSSHVTRCIVWVIDQYPHVTHPRGSHMAKSCLHVIRSISLVTVDTFRFSLQLIIYRLINLFNFCRNNL